MTPIVRQAVWWLGACQCVFWGVLYYGFSVLLVPLETELHLSRAGVAGAFSLGLLAMAVVAPRIGQAFDRGQGIAVTRIGGALAIAGLALLALAASATALYVAWALLGVAMALLLYESAFALVIRAVGEPAQRLRALAAVTVMGGLASTVFLPLFGSVVDRWGWRAAVVGGAVTVLAALVVMERRVLPALPAHVHVAQPETATAAPRHSPEFAALALVFTTSTLASMAITTLLIPLLMSRDVSVESASIVLATLGLTQLPGRIWMLRGGRQPSPQSLASLPLVLQGVGLAGVALAPSLVWSALGVAVFGLGAGLHTLARPWLVQRLHGVADAGYWNGRVARVQGFGRAAGPLAVVAIAAWTSTTAVLWGLSAAMLALIPVARRLTRELPEAPVEVVHAQAAADR